MNVIQNNEKCVQNFKLNWNACNSTEVTRITNQFHFCFYHQKCIRFRSVVILRQEIKIKSIFFYFDEYTKMYHAMIDCMILMNEHIQSNTIQAIKYTEMHTTAIVLQFHYIKCIR